MWEKAVQAYKQRKERLNTAWEELGGIAANRFVSEAKIETSIQGLVKTGNYRGSWNADIDKKGKETVIKCINNAEYASHLEYGHRIVTRTGKDTGRKTKGRFVGRTAINRTRKFISGTVKKLLRKIFV
jgi:hypothetical protein